MSKVLTDQQKAALKAIKDYIRKEGVPPTNMEVADLMGLEYVNAAREHIQALARKGYIEVVPRKARGIRVLK